MQRMLKAAVFQYLQKPFDHRGQSDVDDECEKAFLGEQSLSWGEAQSIFSFKTKGNLTFSVFWEVPDFPEVLRLGPEVQKEDIRTNFRVLTPDKRLFGVFPNWNWLQRDSSCYQSFLHTF